MVESPAQDVTVRTHLLPGGREARGAVFVGRLGAFRYEASRHPDTGWMVTFAPEPEIPQGLHEHLVAAALSSIGVAEGLFRQPPPAILSVRPEDLENEALELQVDVRDIFEEVGIAQGFVVLPGKGRFTFQADQQPDGEWSVAFGIDLTLPEEIALRLERTVRARIEEIVHGKPRR
ncbi:MAG: hypothetical protein ACP5SI_06925 [Chloroflexia bacterium]